MPELKPCPFCDSKIWKYKGFKGITFFKCLFCGAVISFEGCSDEEESINHFNRRANNATD